MPTYKFLSHNALYNRLWLHNQHANRASEACQNVKIPYWRSSNGNINHVTDPLCREFTGHRWIPLIKASDAELWCFLWSAPWINGWVNNCDAGDVRRHRAHYDVMVMLFLIIIYNETMRDKTLVITSNSYTLKNIHYYLYHELQVQLTGKLISSTQQMQLQSSKRLPSPSLCWPKLVKCHNFGGKVLIRCHNFIS